MVGELVFVVQEELEGLLSDSPEHQEADDAHARSHKELAHLVLVGQERLHGLLPANAKTVL